MVSSWAWIFSLSPWQATSHSPGSRWWSSAEVKAGTVVTVAVVTVAAGTLVAAGPGVFPSGNVLVPGLMKFLFLTR
jgi:hypothetical protein